MTHPPPASTRRPRFRRHSWEPLTMTWEEVADRVFRQHAAWLRENLPPDFLRPDQTTAEIVQHTYA